MGMFDHPPVVEFDDLDELVSKIVDYGNEKDLWGEGIEVRLPNGNKVTGFYFDGNTGLVLEVEGGYADL